MVIICTLSIKYHSNKDLNIRSFHQPLKYYKLDFEIVKKGMAISINLLINI
jgi:hypothetical protein